MIAIRVGELAGDGSSVFRNTVDSEINGARSAGRFVLELKVEDDEQGEAVRATWAVTREAPGSVTKAKIEVTDDKVFDFVRALAMRGIVHSRGALRDHGDAPIGDKSMRFALDRLIERDRLKL